MSPDCWNSMPLLPLKCILQRLSLQDALAATATCKNWRIAVSLGLFDGQRETLTLSAREAARSLFVARVFRRRARRLHVLADCRGAPLDEFLCRVVTMFAEGSSLQEIVFIGESYPMLKDHKTLTTKLRRPITERLIEDHKATLRTFALMGCSLDDVPKLACEDSPMNDAPLTLSPQLDEKFGLRPLAFTRVQYIHVDYESLDAAALSPLSLLPALRCVSVSVTRAPRRRLPWGKLRCEVALNVIGVSASDIDEIINNVLVRDMNLVAVRVMFCRILHLELIEHLSVYYVDTLRELQWVDAPRVPGDVKPPCTIQLFDPLANPFIFVCWRCRRLQKLVIHGYWISHYDLIGMVRLRERTLRDLQVSATCREAAAHKHAFDVLPLLTTDRLRAPHQKFVKKINQSLPFAWRPPRRWAALPPALTPATDAAARAAYVARLALAPPPAV